ncbi:nitroreductase family protein [Pedobacter sandarakinus]|uniref:nitroreductase family protein n=1 Tax=Pedobacter sandarakinus TaxID=353156 RepID=UPI002245AE42|nr:nitroreductase [Pedobacter sandarakinus]MCX2575222.1 nitroreductase [Pedobacter sandarakinus]
MGNYEIVSQVIKERRSIFPASYIKKEIPVTVIQQILETANYAPTHKLTQPWRFTVIRKGGLPKLGQALGKLYQEHISPAQFLQKKLDSFAEKTSQADCIIAINMRVSGKIPEWEELAAVSCAVQNMALTAESLKVGAYWSSPPLIAHLGEFLSLSNDEKCIGLFYMGYHNEQPWAPNRTPIADKVQWIED